MNILLRFKEIYREAFRNLGHAVVKNSVKLLFWFCFLSFIVVLYAFVFRVSTGFAFD